MLKRPGNSRRLDPASEQGGSTLPLLVRSAERSRHGATNSIGQLVRFVRCQPVGQPVSLSRRSCGIWLGRSATATPLASRDRLLAS